MAIETALVTFDLHDYLGDNFDARRTKVWLTTNVPEDAIADTATGEVRIGGGSATLSDSGVTEALVPIPGADTNPPTWQTTVHVDYVDKGTRERKRKSFGPYTITESSTLGGLIEEQVAVPTATAADYAAQAEAAVDSIGDAATVATTAAAAAQAAAAQAVDISNIDTPDSLVATLVADSESATGSALSASYARLEGPLGGWQYTLATDPLNAKAVKLGDSNSDPGTATGALYRRLYGVHAQQGEALDGLGSLDVFADGVGNGTTTFTSATANFTAGDVGRSLSGGALTSASVGVTIPAGTVIATVVNSTTVTVNNTIPTASAYTFRVGRHIIGGGNNGMPLSYWHANPNFTAPNGRYNRTQLIADDPDLVIIEWLTNDIREGALGTTEDACYTNGRALLQAHIDDLRAALPDADFLLVTPATFLSADVGDVGHPTPYGYVTDGTNVNPAGLAQTYSTALRRIYLSFVGVYPNVDVLDTQAEVFGTRSVDSHPLMANQIHPSPATSSDLKSLAPVGGGYVAVADAIAKRIGFTPNAFPAGLARRFRQDMFVYSAPAAGQVRLINRDFTKPASQSAVSRSDSLFVNGLGGPFALTSATFDRTFGANFLTITGLGTTDFSPYVGKTATLMGDHPDSSTGEAIQVYVDLPSVAAGAWATVDITVNGLVTGNQGHRVGVHAEPGSGFGAQSDLVLTGVYVRASNAARLVLYNKGASAVDLAGESWTFWLLR